MSVAAGQSGWGDMVPQPVLTKVAQEIGAISTRAINLS